jgi:asparagine synthase (glutamine-hydrolysing)
MARGRIAHACREMARWCTRGRTSFWKFAFENAVVPLLPAAPRRMLRRGGERIPRWIAPSFARRYDLEHRLQWRRLAAPRGDQYAGTVRFEVDHMWSCLDRGVVDDALEMRYPFLYRPLVEFSLALPPAMRTRPFARKWILREAMNGVLPELVRTRRGKGGISGRVELSLVRERARIDAMLRDPVLGQLGAVVPSRVRAAVAAACAGDEWARSQVTTTLALETWLAVRAGRWPEATHRSTPIEHGPLSPVPTR